MGRGQSCRNYVSASISSANRLKALQRSDPRSAQHTFLFHYYWETSAEQQRRRAEKSLPG